jgi:hypothetical protein
METTNYYLFKFFEENRVVNENHVQRLIDSIQKVGFIDGFHILVDQDMRIIDGQTRFNACKRLGIPVPYVIKHCAYDEALALMIELNKPQRPWAMADYVHRWAKGGKACYIYLLKMDENYKLGLSVMFFILFGAVHKYSHKLKAGVEFTPKPKHMDLLNFIMEAKQLVPYYKTGSFVFAAMQLFDKVSPKLIALILKKLPSIPMQVSTAAYLACFENIINRGRSSGNRISLTGI